MYTQPRTFHDNPKLIGTLGHQLFLSVLPPCSHRKPTFTQVWRHHHAGEGEGPGSPMFMFYMETSIVGPSEVTGIHRCALHTTSFLYREDGKQSRKHHLSNPLQQSWDILSSCKPLKHPVMKTEKPMTSQTYFSRNYLRVIYISTSFIWKLWVVFTLSETWAWNQRDGIELQVYALVSCTMIGNNCRALLPSLEFMTPF